MILQECDAITDAGLKHLKTLPNLRRLGLAGCAKLSPAAVKSTGDFIKARANTGATAPKPDPAEKAAEGAWGRFSRARRMTKFSAREAQIEQVACCLSPVLTRHRPVHAWLHGRPGTGKTSTVMRVLRQLEGKNYARSIVINCFEKDTFYEILDEMISGFRILRADEHRTSFKLERLRSFLKDWPVIL